MKVSVVIPLYKQAQFLVESVTSALGQSLEETAVVIVNDGCPDPLSHQLGVAFAASYPDRIAYVRQENGGLSAARNSGIRYAMERWPNIEAIFFLDADNLLKPEALESLLRCLKAADNIGWVYSSLARFGTDHVVWHPATPANLFRMLFENQSDAGSLVRREVFENGIYFDETMREGYEDWEFFIRVLRAGYAGTKSTDTELLYRVKRQSMLTESQSKHDALVAEIHKRHKDIIRPHQLTEVEHSHCPRFMWVGSDGDMFALFTDPERAEQGIQPEGGQRYWPPVLCVGSSDVWKYLYDWNILRSVLLLAQERVPREPICFTIEPGGNRLEIAQTSSSAATEPHLLCLYRSHFQGTGPQTLASITSMALKYSHSSMRLAARVPVPAAECLPARLTPELISSAIRRAHKKGALDVPPHRNTQDSTDVFAWDRHCVRLETTYPISDTNRLHICFAVPWLTLGGVDHCILQLARSFRRLVPDARLHLVITKGGCSVGRENTELFDDIILLTDIDWERKARLCDSIFQSMDLVINAHSEAAFDSLRWRLQRPKQARAGIHVPYLHVIDEAKGQLVGWPFKAAELEHAVDGFAVISDNLRSFLVNHGVSPYRIRLAQNAPVVAPQSKASALKLSERKADRARSGGRLKLLFAGRADYQKGISRLKMLADELLKRGVAFELMFVGDSVLNAESVSWPSGVVRLMPATHDPEQLAAYYAEADVFVLLSRWEGVPLSLLDAMAHGCIVIATDVGAVSELIENGENGLLISNAVDNEVAAQAAQLICDVLKDDDGIARMRQRAIDTAFEYSWDEASRAFLSFLPDLSKTRHCPFVN